MVTVTCGLVGWWWWGLVAALTTLSVLSFFRDPERCIPTDRGVMVSPADGRVTSIHRLENFKPFGEPALCIRVFLSVLNVHVNRSPCHAVVDSLSRRLGRHLSALNPRSAEENEWNLIVLRHPTQRRVIAAVRQVAGRLARTIVCGVKENQIIQRGQRIGMILLGSTTELYIPLRANPVPQVVKGQKVQGGRTILAKLDAAPYQYVSGKEREGESDLVAPAAEASALA